MRFVKIPAIFSEVTDLGRTCKRIFNGTGFSNNIFWKKRFLTIHLFFVLVPLQFLEVPRMVDLKMFQTVYKRTLYEHSP